MKKTNIYVDGLNLYHNSLKKRNLYWLDIKTFVEKSLESLRRKKNLSEEYSINQVKYFTSPVKPQKRKPNLRIEQKLYIKALHNLPNTQVIMGRFSITAQSCSIITNINILNQWKSFSTHKKLKLLKRLQGYFHNRKIKEIENQLMSGPDQGEFINKLWKKLEYEDKIKLAKKLFKEKDTTTQRYVKVEEKETG